MSETHALVELVRVRKCKTISVPSGGTALVNGMWWTVRCSCGVAGDFESKKAAQEGFEVHKAAMALRAEADA